MLCTLTMVYLIRDYVANDSMATELKKYWNEGMSNGRAECPSDFLERGKHIASLLVNPQTEITVRTLYEAVWEELELIVASMLRDSYSFSQCKECGGFYVYKSQGNKEKRSIAAKNVLWTPICGMQLLLKL